jgi:sporulation integral membrane protein YtvI
MIDFYKENREYIGKLIAVFLFFALIYMSVKFILPFVAPFVFAYLFSACINPAVNYLEKKFKMLRGFATAIIMILFIILMILLFNLLAGSIIRQAQEFVEALPEYAKEISDMTYELENKFNRFFEFMPSGIKNMLNSLAENIEENIEENAGDVISDIFKTGGGGLIKTIPSALIGIIIWFVSSFFFTKDKYVIGKFINSLIPGAISDKLHDGRKRMGSALKGYVKAQLTIMSIIAVISIAGLFIINYPYALLLGVVIAVVDALPLFGSGFILLPWAAISAISGDYNRTLSLLALYLAIVLARQICEPKILGNHLGIHPILTLMSIYIGLKLFGLLGIILGPISVVTMVGLFANEKNA